MALHTAHGQCTIVKKNYHLQKMTLQYRTIKEGLKEIFELRTMLDRLDEFYQKIFHGNQAVLFHRDKKIKI